jgi:hypothetical protein
MVPGFGDEGKHVRTGNDVTDDDIFAFVRASVRSVWALELLLLLRRDPGRAWSPDELVRELRGSPAIVAEELAGLQRAGLVAAEPDGRFRYGPQAPRLDELAAGVQRMYAAKPMAIVKAIMAAPNDKLRIFSDAFRLKG